MARTPVGAFGRLQIDYVAYGRNHLFRVWIPAFNTDPAVGTFVSPTTPASLDALATDLANKIKPLYTSDSGLAFGNWLGGVSPVANPDSFVPTVTGTVTAPTTSFSSGSNPAGAVSQGTWTFRDNDLHLVRHTFLGIHYLGPDPIFYSAMSGGFKDYADYVTGTAVVISRSGVGVASLIDLTFDTNDGLTRRVRR